ncbi:AMP-binding protein [Streptomyces sp. NPDC050095]|uniref:AMP-binding enzyme n=1 Tax=unclassified Streptomyces TaxID=2593676 RepID=UPI003421D028
MPHVEVKVADPETGRPVRHGEPGELHIRGYLVMLGYFRSPGPTAEAVDADGWLHTGDLGTMDANGYVRVVSRLKDMIIRGGENIYPREIEDLLRSHPEVRDVAVIGVPDPVYGEEILAFAVPEEPARPLDPQALRAYCAERIAYHRVPQHIRVVDALPLTSTGKVRKNVLRLQAEARQGNGAGTPVDPAGGPRQA